MKLIRVDFDSIDADGLTRSWAWHANVPLYVGDMVLAYDSAHNTSMATVARIGANGTVHLVMDPAGWREVLLPA
jgi:hypothetical protein